MFFFHWWPNQESSKVVEGQYVYKRSIYLYGSEGHLTFLKRVPECQFIKQHDPSTAITPDHTPDDKDHHLIQTPGQETDKATPGQRPPSSRTTTYKGIPLTIADVNKFPKLRSFLEKKCGRTRAHILCTTCLYHTQQQQTRRWTKPRKCA